MNLFIFTFFSRCFAPIGKSRMLFKPTRGRFLSISRAFSTDAILFKGLFLFQK